MGVGSGKKIAYLLEYPLDLPGGAQMSTESLCRSLLGSESGYVPVVICPHLLKKTPGDYPFEVRTYDMGRNRIGNLLRRVGAFKRIISQVKPDIIHIQMPESLITFYMTGIRGIPLVFTDRGMYTGYRKHTMFLMKRALKDAAMVLTTTGVNQENWKTLGGFGNVRRVSNTVSDVFATYDEDRRRELTEQRNGVFTIGMAGRICEEKDWPKAVRLVGMLADTGLKFRVSLVLSVFEDGDDEKVRDIVEGIRLAIGEENLDFRQDLSQQQMQDYYYGIDVFVMTSVFESFGKVAVEAMSRRCAVVATRVGGLYEVIGKEENLYESLGGEKKAVEYLRRAAADPDFLLSEQEYFYQRFMERFSPDKCLKEHIRIYEEIGR